MADTFILPYILKLDFGGGSFFLKRQPCNIITLHVVAIVVTN